MKQLSEMTKKSMKIKIKETKSPCRLALDTLSLLRKTSKKANRLNRFLGEGRVRAMMKRRM